MKSLRDAKLGWFRGEIKRYEQAQVTFASDPRLPLIRACLRQAWVARHYYRKARKCTS